MVRRNHRLIVAMATGGAALALSIAPVCAAQEVSAADPAALAKAIADSGYRAQLSKDASGDPLIDTAAAGITFSILFYNCTKNTACQSVQFYSGWKDPSNGALSVINDWNSGHRFSRAYISKTGSARLEMDVDLDKGGMSKALFMDNFAVWESLIAEYQTLIYVKPK